MPGNSIPESLASNSVGVGALRKLRKFLRTNDLSGRRNEELRGRKKKNRKMSEGKHLSSFGFAH